MQNTYKKRICIITRSLSEGGADRVASIQSFLFSSLGHQVYLVTVLNSIAYPYQGTLLNLGKMKEKNDNALGRIQRLLKLKSFLKSNKIDVVIDHRVRIKSISEYIISGWVYPRDAIYMVHNSTIERYFPSSKLITRLIYGNQAKIVCVSDAIANKVRIKYKFNNIQTIYNAIDFNYINKLSQEPCSIEGPFIFWYGRLENEQKNIVLLLKAYNQSSLPDKKIKLVLMGSGKDLQLIKRTINNLNLNSNATLLPFSENPFPLLRKSIFTVISSNYEGFPMTILESLACGIPVVSVRYKNYEDSILKHRFNGVVTEPNSSQALSEGMEQFVDDKKLYLRCCNNAVGSVEPFRIENISKQWEILIQN
ncbi:glycosyltransferase [Winogradskyella aurantiaca]|uniref:glycosyltransferase n=1 Tax=Winogradskyella aurantiaca TaxID=2219558 RepID=UPI000E1C7875|nr:glycosyltransferase [Winogradskyella aurantiaca]